MIPATEDAYDVAVAMHYLHEIDPGFHTQVVSELGARRQARRDRRTLAAGRSAGQAHRRAVRPRETRGGLVRRLSADRVLAQAALDRQSRRVAEPVHVHARPAAARGQRNDLADPGRDGDRGDAASRISTSCASSRAPRRATAAALAHRAGRHGRGRDARAWQRRTVSARTSRPRRPRRAGPRRRPPSRPHRRRAADTVPRRADRAAAAELRLRRRGAPPQLRAARSPAAAGRAGIRPAAGRAARPAPPGCPPPARGAAVRRAVRAAGRRAGRSAVRRRGREPRTGFGWAWEPPDADADASPRRRRRASSPRSGGRRRSRRRGATPARISGGIGPRRITAIATLARATSGSICAAAAPGGGRRLQPAPSAATIGRSA